MTCAACGASLRPDAAWCGQCHATAGALAVAAPARFQPAAEQQVLPTYSRWRKTDTSFGPFGRISWTVGMLLGLGLMLFSRDPFAIGAWLVIAMPLVLRSVWKAGRVS